MPASSQRPSSSSRDLTLVVESTSGTPEEYFAQVNPTLGRVKSPNKSEQLFVRFWLCVLFHLSA